LTQYDVRGLWLLSIIGAEALTIFVNPLGGMIVYLLLLLLLATGASLVRKDPIHRFYLALGLVPLIRIVNLSMPLSDVSPVYSYLIMAVPIVIGAAAVAMALRMRPADIGLAVHGIPLQILVALLGVAIGYADYLILKPEPLIDALTFRSVLLPALVLLAVAGFVEGLVFRGVLQGAAEASPGVGWIYVALVSTVLQMGQRSILHMALAVGMALAYGWTVKRTGSILGVCLSQGVAAICLYLVFPFVF
jgi:membrane protease YdiL (CAAX protease family)